MQFIFNIYFLLHLSVVYLHIDHSLPQRKTAKIVWLQNDRICHLIIIFDNFKQHSSLWSKYVTHHIKTGQLSVECISRYYSICMGKNKESKKKLRFIFDHKIAMLQPIYIWVVSSLS